MVADQAQAPLGMEMGAVEADDARGFLAAMLERVEAKRREGGGIGMSRNIPKTPHSSRSRSSSSSGLRVSVILMHNGATELAELPLPAFGAGRGWG